MKNLTELKADLHKAEKQLAAADFEEGKKFAQAKIDRLTKEIETAEKAGGTPAPAKKKDKAKTAVHGKNSKKTALKKASVEYKGKVYYEGDPEYCDVLQKITDERLEKAKKANKQHKTKPISISVGETLTHAVEKAVNNISAEDAKKYSKRYVVALRTIKKQFTGLLGSFKTLLGEDYDREEIKQAIDVINEMIEDIQENVTKKMAKGGGIENQYEDKSAGEVWGSWTTTQRMHFLSDHIKDKQHTPATIEEYTKKSYKFLPQDIKYLVLEHTLTGEYGQGGFLSRFFKKKKPKEFRVAYLNGVTEHGELFETKDEAEKVYNQMKKNPYNKYVSLDRLKEGTVNDWYTIAPESFDE